MTIEWEEGKAMNRKRIFRLAWLAVALMTVPLSSASLSRAQEPGFAEIFDDAAMPGGSVPPMWL